MQSPIIDPESIEGPSPEEQEEMEARKIEDLEDFLGRMAEDV